MYRIAICDDEAVFLRFLHESLIKSCERLAIPYEIACFLSAKDLLYAVLTENKPFDIFLLDILMAELNGIDLAKKIRELNSDATIVFISATKEYALHGYEVRAVRYLVKPVNAALLEELIVSDYNERFLLNFVTLKFDSHSERVSLDDILAIEIVGRKLAIHLKDKIFTYSAKLSDILALFPAGVFIYTHQSYAVNIRNLKAIDRHFAVTSGNQVFPISRSKLKDVQMAFLSYMGR